MAASTSMAVLLVGCLGSGTTDASALDSAVVDFDETTGAIVGRVADDSLVPVADATVTLDGRDAFTTNSTGHYVFSNLPPGSYELHFAAPGHYEARKEVNVAAGRLTDAGIVQLRPWAGGEPFYQVREINGFDECSVVVNDRGTISYLGEQGWPLCDSTFLVDSFANSKAWLIYSYESIAGISGWYSETTWTATQLLGDSMTIAILLPGPGVFNAITPNDRLDEVYVRWTRGESPQQIRMTIEDLYTTPASGRDRFNDTTACEYDGYCEINVWHYAAASASSQGNVGLQFQQRFDHYMTSFHNGPLPETFSILPDS